MRSILLFLFFCVALSSFAQEIIINGFAPSYLGSKVDLLQVDDYLSFHTTPIATAKVKEDSTFQFKIENRPTQKLLIRSNNNTGFLYIQPGGKYDIFFPARDRFDPYRKSGNQVEVTFFNLDSTDINYKTLSFQRWVDYFIGNTYHLKSVKPLEFVDKLDTFKINVEENYKNDTSSFFKTYVKFTIAGLDNIATATERSRYEKYDFYLKRNTVHYHNDVFMTYFSDFYQNLFPGLVPELNEEVYQGVIKASPTVIMNALGKEYTLKNVRYRELVMIKSLAEVYYSDDYPQTNILTILDSISEHALFEDHKIISKNIVDRLTALVPGGKAPNFALVEGTKPVTTLSKLKGKHAYIHFADPDLAECKREFELLKELHEKYGDFVQFITIYKDIEFEDTASVNNIEGFDWNVYKVDADSKIWKDYRVESFPQYVLIDPEGYVVASPALRPTPNGQYETIDKTFFYIRKAWQDANPEEKEFYDRNK